MKEAKMTSKREPSDINVPAGPELVLEAPWIYVISAWLRYNAAKLIPNVYNGTEVWFRLTYHV